MVEQSSHVRGGDLLGLVDDEDGLLVEKRSALIGIQADVAAGCLTHQLLGGMLHTRSQRVVTIREMQQSLHGHRRQCGFFCELPDATAGRGYSKDRVPRCAIELAEAAESVQSGGSGGGQQQRQLARLLGHEFDGRALVLLQ